MANHVLEQGGTVRIGARPAEKRGSQRKPGWLHNPLGDRPTLVSLVLALLVFAVDASTPLGVASAIPYSLAVLVALKARWQRFVFGFAFLCSLLTLADLAIGPGPGGTEMWKVVTNRFLALFMIWITTILGVRRRKAEDQRRRAEEQTRLHLADLAHLERVKTAGELAAGLAHEMNQPLTAISLQSEIAARLASSDEPTSREALLPALREIAEQSQRAAAIIRSLRGLVRKCEPQRLPLDLNEVIHETTQLIDAVARPGEIDVELRLADCPRVLGDRVQLQQVLLNLLQNALEAIMEASDGPRLVCLETRLNGEQVVVTVRDTGVGLPADDTQRVFERFYSTKPRGMGMGLAISRSIVDAHGGRLWAEVNTDRGATFVFTLPTSPER